jgi:hypothetical protein
MPRDRSSHVGTFRVSDFVGRNAILDSERGAQGFINPKLDDGKKTIGLIVREESEQGSGG